MFDVASSGGGRVIQLPPYEGGYDDDGMGMNMASDQSAYGFGNAL